MVKERIDPLFNKVTADIDNFFTNDNVDQKPQERKCEFCGASMIYVKLRNNPKINGYFCSKDRVVIPEEQNAV